MIDTAQSEMAFALSVVREAAQMAQRIQSGMAMRGLTKSDLSPVTVADYAVQALVARRLEESTPDSVLVAEEGSEELRSAEGAPVLALVTEFLDKVFPGITAEQACDWIDHGAAVPSKRFWTLDPIDGTKGYLRSGQYAIALAAIDSGQVELAVLGCPNLGADCTPDLMGAGSLLGARRGEGAWATALNAEDEPFRPLHVSERSEIFEARMLRSVESAHTNVDKIDEIAFALGLEAEPVRIDSQAKYAMLAAAQAEFLLRLLSPAQLDYKEKIWDQAAGSLLLEEAGGRITDLDGKPLDFTQGRRLENNRGICASNKLVHDAVLQAIAQVGA